jgi:hypothetical protein
MQQKYLRCERTRKLATIETLPEQQSNPTNCPFLAARLTFEKEVAPSASLFSSNKIDALPLSSLNDAYAWTIVSVDSYWGQYIPTRKTLTFESETDFRLRLKAKIECSPFFKWRYNNEQRAIKKENQLTLATWFLSQHASFTEKEQDPLFVLEMLRTATDEQLIELVLLPNLLIGQALYQCPEFAEQALRFHNFETLNKQKVVDVAFATASFADQLQFFNSHIRELPPSIVTSFLTNHQEFAKNYFLGQIKDQLPPAILACYINAEKPLAFLDSDLASNNPAKAAMAIKTQASTLVQKHTAHLRSAFREVRATAVSPHIHIFATIANEELLLDLLRKNDDALTDCLLRNYKLYENFFMSEDNILPQLDFSQPHLAAHFVQYIPVKNSLNLKDEQISELAKRTDKISLDWLMAYFPINIGTLTSLALQHRHLLEHILLNPKETIVESLISGFPTNEARPVKLLTDAMDKLQKYYPLTKSQLVTILRLYDDTITDWLFVHAPHFTAMTDILNDKELSGELRDKNPRFLAHTISADNTSFEVFFDMILANPIIAARLLKYVPDSFQYYVSAARQHLDHHINPEPILTILRAAPSASSLPDTRSQATNKPDIPHKITELRTAISQGTINFSNLVNSLTRAQGLDKLINLYVLYTYQSKQSSIADKEYNNQPAKIAFGTMLINECIAQKNYDLLAMVLEERSKVTKTIKVLIGADKIEEINYLPEIKSSLQRSLQQLATSELLTLLSNKMLCAVIIKYYQSEVRDLLCRRAETDNAFTLMLLCNQEQRDVIDSRINTLENPRPLLSDEEKENLLIHICNHTGNDASGILAVKPTLLSWLTNKIPQRVKYIIIQGLDTNVLTIDAVLRSPELMRLFTADELLNRLTPTQAKFSLHYRHVWQLFNDETKLSRLLQKANITAATLLQNKLFELQTVDNKNYDYAYARYLLQRLNGEQVTPPKVPAQAAASSPAGSFISLGSSSASLKPYAVVGASEKTTAPSSAAAAAVAVSPRQTGTPVKKESSKEIVMLPLSDSSPIKPTAALTPPVQSPTGSFVVPPLVTPVRSSTSPALSPSSPPRGDEPSKAASAVASPPPATPKQVAVEPTPVAAVDDIVNKKPEASSIAPASSATEVTSPTSSQDETKTSAIAPPPAPPLKPSAPKAPPPPPALKPKAPAAQPPEGASGTIVSQRGSLLDAIKSSGGKPPAKSAAKGPGLFANSSAAAAASPTAASTSSINSLLLSLITAFISKDNNDAIQTQIVPAIELLGTANDQATYEKKIDELKEILKALGQGGLAGTLMLALSSRRSRLKTDSAYDKTSSPLKNGDEWDEEAPAAATRAEPSAASIHHEPTDKLERIITETRRLYPFKAPSTQPSM